MITPEQADTVQKAVRYYLNPFEELLLAMIAAEGGADAFVKAVQCSLPGCDSFEVAVARACKTIRNRFIDGIAIENPFKTKLAGPIDPITNEPNPRCLAVSDTFVDLLAARWAPIGASNDPTGLNKNFAVNVKAIINH